MMTKAGIFAVVIMGMLVGNIHCNCAYLVKEDGKPEKTDQEAYLVQDLTQCIEYNGKMGCCNINNDVSQVTSYVQIDGVFGSQGGGCDICSINLKRFWCQYACSPRQSQFMTTTKEFYPVPNPQKPDETIMVQKVKLTVHADTACSLFNSCKRVGFVSSVSAMSSPAGFLSFQGHNAVNQAFQYIQVQFSYDKNKSLLFTDDVKDTEPERAALQLCNYTTNNDTVHGFPFLKNCTCNDCEDSCDENNGFIYTQSGVFEEFNLILVASVWASSILVVGALTYYRKRSSKEKQQ